jgi:hypothetical protein
MGLSFTINSVPFVTLAGPVSGRYALGEDTPAPNVDIIRYHVKGVDGEFKTFNGAINFELTFKLRYIGANPYTGMRTDWSNWAGASVTILSYAGDTWKRCTLKDKGMRPLGQSRAVGGGLHQLDVIAEFIGSQLPNT